MWAQLCLILCDPVDGSLPGSSDHVSFPGRNIGVGCHFLHQGIFLIQGSNTCLLHWYVDASPLPRLGSPIPHRTVVISASLSSVNPSGKLLNYKGEPLDLQALGQKYRWWVPLAAGL